MLDLYAVKTQIDDMVADERQVQEDFRTKLELALSEYRRWAPEWEVLAQKIDKSRTSCLLPGLSEGLGGGVALPERQEPGPYRPSVRGPSPHPTRRKAPKVPAGDHQVIAARLYGGSGQTVVGRCALESLEETKIRFC